MKLFLLDLLDLLHLTTILLFPPNIFYQVLHWCWFSKLFIFRLSELFRKRFFFFLNGSWWDFRLIFLFLFSVCWGSNKIFSSFFIEPYNIVLIAPSFSLTVCNTSDSVSTRYVRFRTSFNSSLQIGPIDLETFPLFGSSSNTCLISNGSSMLHSHWHGFLWLSLSSRGTSSGS